MSSSDKNSSDDNNVRVDGEDTTECSYRTEDTSDESPTSSLLNQRIWVVPLVLVGFMVALVFAAMVITWNDAPQADGHDSVHISHRPRRRTIGSKGDIVETVSEIVNDITTTTMTITSEASEDEMTSRVTRRWTRKRTRPTKASTMPHPQKHKKNKHTTAEATASIAVDEDDNN
ncbi:uncharacterized protein LOC135393904 [Ornithodoros turicata]|uniref:uncharacterized protein LOC135393904 n=1 Tax=Ornithodoros turicata TaxID=34597 RepID=UPI0031390939